MEEIILDMSRLNNRLSNRDTVGCLTKDEQHLEKLASKCQKISRELVKRLEGLKLGEGIERRKWKSLRQALKATWSKDAIDNISEQLSQYRSELNFNVLVSMK